MEKQRKPKKAKIIQSGCAIVLSASILTVGAAASSPSVVSSRIDTVSVSAADSVKYGSEYDQALSSSFPNGFKPGFGSALAYKDTLADGSIEYYGLGDRGPNVDAPNVIYNGKTYNGKFFVTPDYTPSIAVIKVSADGKTSAVEENSEIKLKNRSGKALTGTVYDTNGLTLNTSSKKKSFLQFTPSINRIADTGEIALDANLNPLTHNTNPTSEDTDISSIDSEGLAVDSNGNFWVADEYGPFIVEFDSTGKEIKRLQPGNGLPGILVNRIPNRGLEDLTLSPDGKYLFAAEQSVLDIGGTNQTSSKGTDANGKTTGTANFVRIMKIDLSTGTTVATYGYPITASDGNSISYKNKKTLMLGDIFALSDTSLLVMEHGTGTLSGSTFSNSDSYQNVLYTFDMSKATNLDQYEHDTYDSSDSYQASVAKDDETNALENDAALPSSVTLGSKTMLLDLRANGWPTDIQKSEGLVVNPDGKTITVVNDNDFTASYTLTNPADTSDDAKDITNYTVSIDASGKKTWYYSNTMTAADLSAATPVSDPGLKFTAAPATSSDEDVEDSQDYLMNITLSSPIMTPYAAKAAGTGTSSGTSSSGTTSSGSSSGTAGSTSSIVANPSTGASETFPVPAVVIFLTASAGAVLAFRRKN